MKEIIAIMGPTASGKTHLAISLAKAVNGSIISVDSATIYRGMNIGTAKPTVKEQEGIPHYLFDICEPEDNYSVKAFCEDALQAIEEIKAAGRVPLLVGGTMMYFNALFKGVASMPGSDQQIRERLKQEPLEKLHQQLMKIDKKAALRIHPNDPQRIWRALEVYELTGKSLSEWQKETVPFLDPSVVLQVLLMPENREALRENIKNRFEAMMQSGFLEEVVNLRKNAELDKDKPSMRSVGYRQLWEHLDGKLTLEEAHQRAVIATGQLAKRQMTWMRSWPFPHLKMNADHLNVEEAVNSIVQCRCKGE